MKGLEINPIKENRMLTSGIFGGVLSVTVRNIIDNLSSNPGQDCLCYDVNLGFVKTNTK